MTAEQIEIGDKLLKYFLEKGGSVDKDQMYRPFPKDVYSYDELIKSTITLQDANLIIYDPKQYRTRLLPDGYEAAKIGLAEYFRKKDYAIEVDIRSKRTGIRSANWTLAISGLALLVSIVAVFKEDLKAIITSPEETIKGNNNSSNGHHQSDSIQHKLSVPELIPEIADRLKHDSVFIKELAKELKRQQ